MRRADLNYSGDPIIVDAGSDVGRVLMDQHGGRWSPVQIAPTFAEYLAAWSRWLRVWRRFEGNLRDDRSLLRPAVRAAIEGEVLGSLPQADRSNWMRFVG